MIERDIAALHLEEIRAKPQQQHTPISTPTPPVQMPPMPPVSQIPTVAPITAPISTLVNAPVSVSSIASVPYSPFGYSNHTNMFGPSAIYQPPTRRADALSAPYTPFTSQQQGTTNGPVSYSSLYSATALPFGAPAPYANSYPISSAVVTPPTVTSATVSIPTQTSAPMLSVFSQPSTITQPTESIPSGAAVGPVPLESLSCRSCTYLNRPDSDECEICGTALRAYIPPPPRQSQRARKLRAQLAPSV